MPKQLRRIRLMRGTNVCGTSGEIFSTDAKEGEVAGRLDTMTLDDSGNYVECTKSGKSTTLVFTSCIVSADELVAPMVVNTIGNHYQSSEPPPQTLTAKVDELPAEAPKRKWGRPKKTE